jgi:ABC-2 type transport system ATP-binding protein
LGLSKLLKNIKNGVLVVDAMDKLECRGLTKVYDDHRTALDNVSLSVETKGIFGLIGRNGAGKTTLIRILATELEPTSGTASIDGKDILTKTDWLRKKIAIVPQEARAIRWMTPTNRLLLFALAGVPLQRGESTRL